MIELVQRQPGAQIAGSMDEVSRLEEVALLQDEVSTSPPDFPALLSLVATRAHQLTGAFGAMVGMQEQDGLVCRAATGAVSALLGLRAGTGGDLLGLALTTDQILVCDDACTDKRVDPVMWETLNLRSMAVAPLRSGRRCFGVLVITSPSPSAFGSQHRQILRLAAGILASRLDLAEEHRARELLLTENAIALATLRESEMAKLLDITAQKKTEDALRRLADRDDLTGLYNRREMLRLLRQETSRSDRHSRPVSLIMLDVDGFKKVNDTYGHQVGDSALQGIARIVEECVRSFDRVARYGGEEFAVILPDTAAADALVVAERIRARVAAEDFSIGPDDEPKLRIPLTISAGVTTMIGDHDKAVELLIKEADAGLYAAKHAGRNRCVPTASAAGSTPG